MSKRRTRKDKEKAKHQFSLSFSYEPKKETSEPHVKRQFPDHLKAISTPSLKTKSALVTAKEESLLNTKRNIKKSLIIVSLILALELVIYLAWSR